MGFQMTEFEFEKFLFLPRPLHPFSDNVLKFSRFFIMTPPPRIFLTLELIGSQNFSLQIFPAKTIWGTRLQTKYMNSRVTLGGPDGIGWKWGGVWWGQYLFMTLSQKYIQ